MNEDHHPVRRPLGESGMSQAEIDVLAERRRQVEVEGFDAEHDSQHWRGELSAAAATYAFTAGLSDYDRSKLADGSSHVSHIARSLWPRNWDDWFKPKDRRRDLVRSAALAIAAIDNFDRAQASARKALSGEKP